MVLCQVKYRSKLFLCVSCRAHHGQRGLDLFPGVHARDERVAGTVTGGYKPVTTSTTTYPHSVLLHAYEPSQSKSSTWMPARAHSSA